MLDRPGRLSVVFTLLAYVQAAVMSLCFVICLDDDGCAVLEKVAGHCCTGGVPNAPSHSHDDETASNDSHGPEHPCAGCVDVPLLGHTSRSTPPVSAPPPEAVAMLEEELSADSSATALAFADLALRPVGLSQFDDVLLTC